MTPPPHRGGTWRALHTWIARGGSLLRVFDPVRLGSEADFLEGFCPGVRAVSGDWFCPEVLGRVSSVDESAPPGSWLPIHEVDVEALVGRSATMTLVAGQPLYTDPWEQSDSDPHAARRDDSPPLDAAPVLLESLSVPQGAFVIPVRRHRRREGWLQVPTDARPVPSGGETGGYVYLHFRVGRGTVTALGSARSFDDDNLGRSDNLLFLQWLLRRWLPGHAAMEVASRMARPQRHRMLNAYPMAPLTPPIADATHGELEALETAPLREARGLIVGVLPHPFCNPAVHGCGFCTFPHEGFSHARAHAVSRRVVAELDAFRARAPGLAGSPVEALYLGGGTANLTPTDDLIALGGAPRARGFLHSPRDARVLWLTRKVVTLGFERAAYRALFGTDAVADFAVDFEALADVGLVAVGPERVLLTERGMFYADTVAGLLASRQVHDRRLRERLALGRPAPPEALPFEVNGDFMG